jgi:protein-ribulosamine 3-kinase
MFEMEARGLSILHSANAIKIPEVIVTGDADGISYLVLEFIDPGTRRSDFWKDFGRKLAALHRHSSGSFGLDHDNYIGSLQQSNLQRKTWIEFFITERLEKQIELANNLGSISNLIIQQFHNVFKRLPDLIPVEKPSLVHGDLWNGNYIVAEDGSACLIDPAVYYGHREMDLAMMRLFGGFGHELYEAYNEVFPLENGFESRIDIHNLYPLMVHVNLFGESYLSQVKAILSRFK